MVARRVWCGLLCAAGGVGALELHEVKPSRGISVKKQPKTPPLMTVVQNEQVSLRAVDEPKPVEEAKPTEPPAPRTRKAWTPTYMKAPDGTWVPVKIVGFGSKTATYNVIVTPVGFAQYEVPDVAKSSLRKVEEFEEVIPEKAPRKIDPTPTKKASKDHYVRMTVKDAEGKEILQAKMLNRSPMRALMHMSCDKLKLGKWSCERDTAFLTSKGNQVNASDTPDTLELVEGAEITIARHTAELHGKYAHKDPRIELQKQLAEEEEAREAAAEKAVEGKEQSEVVEPPPDEEPVDASAEQSAEPEEGVEAA